LVSAEAVPSLEAGDRLTPGFFTASPEVCAEALLGCRIVWWKRAGIIVETEAYAARNDPACHTARRPSARQFVSSHPPGAAYVYFNYGVHWMLNVLVGGGEPGFVLLRALEPTHGIDAMRTARSRHADRDLCSGPGKLAQALGVNKSHHGLNLCQSPHAGFLPPVTSKLLRKCGPRIGISSGKDIPWRFWVRDNPHVSR
jgi:DNA-3-methyladenine glycosylase